MRLGTAIECLVDNYKYASDKEWINDKVAWALYHTWKEADRKTENSSEKPNNCEHITEDGVTCAKYPACDDCLDNPLNKVKGSKRLLKGKDEPTGYNLSPVDKDINVRSKDEPQYDAEDQFCIEHNCPHFYQFGGCMNQGDCPYDEDEPQTESE